eukprot:scaffold351_cov162-Ochromonas_danica.AAC.1
MMMFLTVLSALFLFSCTDAAFSNSTATATYGVDISSALSSTVASCFASAGLTYIIPRGYRSSGSVDTNVCISIKTAASAGITTRDVYMFP